MLMTAGGLYNKSNIQENLVSQPAAAVWGGHSLQSSLQPRLFVRSGVTRRARSYAAVSLQSSLQPRLFVRSGVTRRAQSYAAVSHVSYGSSPPGQLASQPLPQEVIFLHNRHQKSTELTVRSGVTRRARSYAAVSHVSSGSSSPGQLASQPLP